MNADKIAELLQPFVPPGSLSQNQLDALVAYLDLLVRWNTRTNLTAVRDEKSIVVRHFGESLFAASKLLGSEVPGKEQLGAAIASGQRPLSVVDVGSGAGFPGMPMKIYAPSIDLTLIESQNKKATFLKEVIRALHLERASVYGDRAETYKGRADLVTLRAVEQFERVLPVAARLVRSPEAGTANESAIPRCQGGTIGVLIGGGQRQAAERILPSFEWQDPLPVPLSTERILLIGTKQVNN
jgi:16S rRNA (guanine527-N7)-methyltransferase